MNKDLVVTATGVRHETVKGPIKVDKVSAAEYQKAGTLTAQIRQEVTTNSTYPSKKVSSSMNANVFDNDDFGFEGKQFSSTEKRVAWILVPVGTTVEQVQAKLDAAFKNGACIYKVLSNEPILDENQKYAITQGLRTKDEFANSQAVRYPDNAQTQAEGTANKLVLDNAGRVQYRRTFFWKTPMEDQDARGNGNVYLSAELKAELQGASVMEGQTI